MAVYGEGYAAASAGAYIGIDGLPEDEQKILRQVYGVQIAPGRSGFASNQIKKIREASGNEAVMQSLITQTLYKYKGTLLPRTFNMAVNKYARANEIFCTNYCRVSATKVVAVVFDERNKMSSVVFKNLENLDADELDDAIAKLMEADMRQDFDLRYDCLIRFAVIHTAADEYAILVTGISSVLPSFVFADFIKVAAGETDSFSSAGEKLASYWRPNNAAAKNVNDYWSRMLKNLPQMPTLPGEKNKTFGALKIRNDEHQASYTVHIPSDIISDLKTRAKSNKLMLLAILETAWGLLLQNHNKSNDVSFCIVTGAFRDTDSDEMAVRKSIIPVRVKNGDDVIIRDIIDADFKQLIISQPYACYDWSVVEPVLQKQGKRFNHFLNFCSLLRTDEERYSKATADKNGKIVAQNSWDVRGSYHLGVYFRAEENKISVSFLGNDKYFQADGLKLLAEQFLLTVKQVLTDWDAPVNFFAERLLSRRTVCVQEEQPSETKLQDYISKLDLLQERDEGVIQYLRRDATLFTRFEGDRLSGKDVEDNMIFIAEGRVARSVDVGDGWYNTLDILKESSWVNDNLFIAKDGGMSLSVEVLTERAIFLSIPLVAVRKLLYEHPGVAVGMICYIGRQLDKYRRLWLSS